MSKLLKLTKQDTNFEAFSFISQAIAKTDGRYPLSKAYYHPEGLLVGCDGHRIHAVNIDLEDIPRGNYIEFEKVNKSSILGEIIEDDNIKYPNVKTFLDYHIPKKAKTRTFEHIKDIDCAVSAVVGWLGSLGILVNYKLVIPIFEKRKDWTVCGIDSKSPVFFAVDNFKAVVMPFDGNRRKK